MSFAPACHQTESHIPTIIPKMYVNNAVKKTKGFSRMSSPSTAHVITTKLVLSESWDMISQKRNDLCKWKNKAMNDMNARFKIIRETIHARRATCGTLQEDMNTNIEHLICERSHVAILLKSLSHIIPVIKKTSVTVSALQTQPVPNITGSWPSQHLALASRPRLAP